MASESSGGDLPARYAALLIAAGYALLGWTYILASDRILLWFSQDAETLTRLQSIKGWAFILASSILLFIVIHLAVGRVRRVEVARRAADERFRRMIEMANEGVWILDAAGMTTFVNDTMASMLGGEPHDIVGKHFTEFVTDDWQAISAAQFDRRRKGLQDVYECRFQKQSGEPVWTIVAATPLRTDSGAFAGSLRMVTDITELKETEHALKQSLDAERRLLNELNHRVRNNLSSLISLIDISRGAAAGRPADATGAARVQGDVDRFAEAIRARINAMNRAYGLVSGGGWRRQDFKSLLIILLPAEHERRVHFSGPPVEFSPYLSGALAIVFHELISNAIQHGALSNETGEIEVAWQRIETGNGNGHIELTWHERGGPAPPVQITPGAGLQLVEGLVRSDLRGKVRTERTSDGIRHTLHLTLSEIPAATSKH